MELSKQQAQAVDAVTAWFKTPAKVFTLSGAAGTGKTSIAKYIVESVSEEDGDVIFCAYTGKAAAVLASKGCTPASTLHSLLYRAKLNEQTGVWTFNLDYESPAKTAKLVIVDEVSMLDESTGNDLLRVAKKILVLGDNNQLPPIKGEPFFDLTNPDFMLTEIHRQAVDNPIIRLATDIRNGIPLKLGTYGESKVLKNKEFRDEWMHEHDQVLVGTNSTRHGLNFRYRKTQGRENTLPVVDDKLICLKNNRERGYLNGTMWKVDSAVYDSDATELAVQPFEGGTGIKIFTFNEYFDGTDANLSWKTKMQGDEFAYGYAITVHKSQGSSWPSVLIVDQSCVFKEHAIKWLYTAVTRASERVTVLI